MRGRMSRRVKTCQDVTFRCPQPEPCRRERGSATVSVAAIGVPPVVCSGAKNQRNGGLNRAAVWLVGGQSVRAKRALARFTRMVTAWPSGLSTSEKNLRKRIACYLWRLGVGSPEERLSMDGKEIQEWVRAACLRTSWALPSCRRTATCRCEKNRLIRLYSRGETTKYLQHMS